MRRTRGRRHGRRSNEDRVFTEVAVNEIVARASDHDAQAVKNGELVRQLHVRRASAAGQY